MNLESPDELNASVEELRQKPAAPEVDPAARAEELEKKFSHTVPAPTTSPEDSAKIEKLKARLNTTPVSPATTQEVKQNIPTTPEKPTSPENSKEKSVLEKAREKALSIVDKSGYLGYKNYSTKDIASSLRQLNTNSNFIDSGLSVAAGAISLMAIPITQAIITDISTSGLLSTMTNPAALLLGITLTGGITSAVVAYKSIRNKLLARKLEKLDNK